MSIPTVSLSTDFEVSKIVYGLMNLKSWGRSPQELVEHLEFCLDQGITTFDHADIYGSYECESLFGKALTLQSDLRERMQLVTKCGIQLLSDNRPDTYIKHYNTSYQHITASVDQSLKNLQTDYIDLLLIHRPDPMMEYEEVARAFFDLNKAGKVLHFGVSNFSVQQYKSLQSRLNFKLLTNQIEISVLQLAAFFDGNMDFFQEVNLSPMAWSPLAGGRIFNPNDPQSERVHDLVQKMVKEGVAENADQILLAFLFQHPVEILPIIGTGKRDRILSAIKALDVSLTQQQWFELWTASTGKKVP
jgi:predicted oxidoreductase